MIKYLAFKVLSLMSVKSVIVISRTNIEGFHGRDLFFPIFIRSFFLPLNMLKDCNSMILKVKCEFTPINDLKNNVNGFWKWEISCKFIVCVYQYLKQFEKKKTSNLLCVILWDVIKTSRMILILNANPNVLVTCKHHCN